MQRDTSVASKPTIVVTGAAGFLGKAIVRCLRLCNVNVIPVTRSGAMDYCRVTDYSETPHADILIHLAEDSNRHRVNAAGKVYEDSARNTLAALLAKQYAHVVYASSAVLYGDVEATPRKVNDATQVVDTYTRVKHHSEIAVRTSESGLVVRLSNLYGPGMDEGNVLGTILKQIPGEGVLRVWDDTPIRDFLWVEDAAEGIVKMALSDKSGIYNLGSGVGTSVFSLAKLALDLCGQPDRQIEASNPSSRLSCLTLDITETKRVWGWQPAVSLPQGLQRLIGLRKRES